MLRHTLRMLGILALLVALLGSFPIFTPPASAAATPTTWTVLVGGQGELTKGENGTMMAAWQFMRFYPDNITINSGDTILFKLNGPEIHTVTFPKVGEKAPDFIVPEGGTSQRMLFNGLSAMPQGKATYDGSELTGSGLLGGDPSAPTQWKLAFDKAGTFNYNCVVHPMMTGKVIVQAAGSAYPKTQAQIDTDVQAQIAADEAAAKKAEASFKPAATRPGPNGTTIHEVQLGYGEGILSWMRFNPGDLTIHVGDTVEWKQSDTEAPHTVTFTSGDKDPDLALVEPQQSGPPKLVFNPKILLPSGGNTYSGKGYVSSGFMPGTKDPTPGPRTFALTFDTPGTFDYMCALHDPMGMEGTITVKPKGS